MDRKSRSALRILREVLIIGLVMGSVQVIYGALTTVTQIGNTGVIASANLRVYWESQCINNVSLISWGTLNPGQSKNITVYVKNIGTVALNLSLSTSDWNPANASTYLTVTFDYSGGQLAPNAVIPVAINLTVSQSIQGIDSFWFQIYVTGTQAA